MQPTETKEEFKQRMSGVKLENVGANKDDVMRPDYRLRKRALEEKKIKPPGKVKLFFRTIGAIWKIGTAVARLSRDNDVPPGVFSIMAHLHCTCVMCRYKVSKGGPLEIIPFLEDDWPRGRD